MKHMAQWTINNSEKKKKLNVEYLLADTPQAIYKGISMKDGLSASRSL